MGEDPLARGAQQVIELGRKSVQPAGPKCKRFWLDLRKEVSWQLAARSSE